jgi:hypothetical protein
MLTKELDTKPAGYFAYAASRDAAMKSYAASTTYTEKQKVQIERMRLGLAECFGECAVHVNFRKKFAVIKFDKNVVRNRKFLALLESDYEKIGVVKTVLATGGVAYRVPRLTAE